MGDAYLPVTVEPLDWIVCFHTTPIGVSRFVPGRFKHVSALAWIESSRLWLAYDVHFHGTRIGIIPAHEFPEFAAEWCRGCALVKMRRRDRSRRLPRVAFSCVGAIKHLLGLSGCVALPDGLWRSCLRNGGVVLHGRDHTSSIRGYARSRRGAHQDAAGLDHPGPSPSARAVAR